MTRYRFKGQTTGPQCRSRVGFENVNCSFGLEKSPSSAGCVSVFLELLACKPKRDNGGQKSEVVSNLYGVAGCKQ